LHIFLSSLESARRVILKKFSDARQFSLEII
jgi:hypothetical protein